MNILSFRTPNSQHGEEHKAKAFLKPMSDIIVMSQWPQPQGESLTLVPETENINQQEVM